MTDSNIFFLDPGQQPTARVTQLYTHLEIYSDGEPVCNTIFVQGVDPQRLLLIDPPVDVTQRFRLDGEVAVLYSGTFYDADLPQLQTEPGGVAHIRIGDHYLDIYSQQHHTVVHFPALGLLYGGEFGSDTVLPAVADGSDGDDEIETLRLLASTLKRKNFQLYLPKYGTSENETVEVMRRLAADVAYLNGLKNHVGVGLERGDAVETIETASRSLLPPERSTQVCQDVHDVNLERMIQANRKRA